MDFFTPEAVSELDTRIENTHDVDQRKNYVIYFIEAILENPSFLRQVEIESYNYRKHFSSLYDRILREKGEWQKGLIKRGISLASMPFDEMNELRIEIQSEVNALYKNIRKMYASLYEFVSYNHDEYGKEAREKLYAHYVVTLLQYKYRVDAIELIKKKKTEGSQENT